MAGMNEEGGYGWLGSRRRFNTVTLLLAFVVFQGGSEMQAEDAGSGQTAKATFGGGCFWCTEAVYAHIKGVQSVTSGYIGGHVADPNYKQVCSGLTGHAEAVEIEYDPATVPFEKLLEIFFATHDPTTLNRQGADVGTQYRSAIFYHDDKQKETSERVIASLNAANVFPSPIVTTLEKATVFYPAEDYHQDYFAANGYQPYCQAVIVPKVEKVRKAFKDLLKDE